MAYATGAFLFFFARVASVSRRGARSIAVLAGR
jgi:hypothetical protein